MRIARNLFSILILIIIVFTTTIMASTGSIQGKITDSQTGEALLGANVLLSGTSIGAATNLDGNYVIQHVEPGTYSVVASYLGYVSKKEKIIVKDGQHVELNFQLKAASLKGETVTVTAQASGQTQAINQKLTSDQIVDVVSAAKIQSLPDANAAESVGRLPGVSVLRQGGEGYAVVIRGMAPQYNQITINGMQMGSSNPNDRSTNLSMISSSVLQGIKVSKTVTADMDANVIGGVVDFDMREASKDHPGIPKFSLQLQGGYNALSDAYNKFNNYMYVGNFEDRILNNKLGIFAQLQVGRSNLTSNELGAYYTHNLNSYTDWITSSVNLYDVPRDKMRYNGALDIDYEYTGGKIKFMNFFSSGKTESNRRSELYAVGSNVLYNNLSNTSNEINSISNMFELNQKIPVFDLTFKLGHTYSETKNPDNWDVSFLQNNAGLTKFFYTQNINPKTIMNSATRDYTQSFLQSFSTSNSFSRSRAINSSLDLETNWNISNLVSADIKFGGMYRYTDRSYNYDEHNTPQLLNSEGAKEIDNIINAHFGFPMNKTEIPVTYFFDPGFTYGTFLKGDYNMYAPLSLGMLTELKNLLESKTKYFEENDPSHYSRNNYQSAIHNYSGNENHYAFYVMSTFKVGQQITVIPGIRYQGFKTKYTGVAGSTTPEAYFAYPHYDTTVTRTKAYWLPDITIKYKPLSWFDVRLSYTNTLSYPSYGAFVPRIDLSGTSINWHNYNLDPAEAENFDAYFSFYNNTLGLFTVGGLLKNIKNMIYSWGFNAKGAEALPYLPGRLLKSYNPQTTYSISTTKNNPYTNKVYGIEVNWQTHFWYLPWMLSGLVLDVNYTHTKSEAQYPYRYSYSNGRNVTVVDTTFKDRITDQPDEIFNISLGYDYKDFSIRVALLYQANIFTSPNFWPQLKGSTQAYRRWDIAAKQKLPWYNIQVYTDLNNINGANDVNLIQAGVPTSIEDYGFTADVGLHVGI